MENPPIFKFGKPSISMGHLYHGYVTNNQMVYHLHQLHQQLCQLYQLQISHPIKSQLYQINYVNGHYQISHPISDPLVNEAISGEPQILRKRSWVEDPGESSALIQDGAPVR